MEFMRTQAVKVEHLSVAFKDKYDRFQKDVRSITDLFIKCVSCGYIEYEDDDKSKPVIVTPAECDALRKEMPPKLTRFIDMVNGSANANGDVDATNKNVASAYGILLDKYRPLLRRRKDSRGARFVLGTNIPEEWKKKRDDKLAGENIDEYLRLNKSKKELIAFVNYGKEKDSTEELLAYRKRYLAGESIEDILSDMGPSDFAAAIMTVKGDDIVMKEIPRIANQEQNYCYAVMDAAVNRMASWHKNHERNQEYVASLHADLEAKTANHPILAPLLMRLSESNSMPGYGVTKNLLRDMRSHVKNKDKAVEPYFETVVAEALKPEYEPLWSASDKELFSAYGILKIRGKISRSKPYISRPRFDADCKMPFAGTGRGSKFELAVNGQAIVIKSEKEVFNCRPSCYFGDPKVRPLKDSDVEDGKKAPRGFRLTYRHIPKARRSNREPRDLIQANVKEIGLLRDGAEYYFHITHKVIKDDGNFIIERFFRTADEEKSKQMLKNLPEKIVAAGFDLNLSTPLTMSVAVVVKNQKKGSVYALDYGCGTMSTPVVVAERSERASEISKVARQMALLRSVIREYDNGMMNEKDVPAKTAACLIILLDDLDLLDDRHIPGKAASHTRMRIQKIMRALGRRSGELVDACRKNGHNCLSETLAILKLRDEEHWLSCAYRNIGVNSKDDCVHVKKENEKRANFRDSASKQFASQAVAAAVKHGANVLFFEDLEMSFDKDSKTNHLVRLLAPGQLTKRIKEACENAGVGCFLVPPNGTSRTDAVSSGPAFRPRYGDRDSEGRFLDHADLYTKTNDGDLIRRNSDLEASCNVTLSGLSHGIVPYSILVKNGVPDGIDGAGDKKRLRRFLKEIGFVKGTSFPSDSNGRLYWLGHKFITTEVRNSMVNAIKRCAMEDPKSKIMHLDASGDRYRAFQIPRPT